MRQLHQYSLSFETIAPQVRALIVENVLHRGTMTWEQAITTFNISRTSLARIIRDEKKKVESLKAAPKRRGCKPTLTVDSLVIPQ